MQRSTMLKFDNSYPMDKDLGYTVRDEEHFADLFEQYLKDDPTPLAATADAAADFHVFDYPYEETEPSESSSADSKLATLNSPPAGLNYVPLQRALALRPRQTLAQPQPVRAISSSELLSLEGKAPLCENLKSVLSTSSSSTAPTLRRKAKFCASTAEQQRGKSEKTSRELSLKMSRPSFADLHHESTPYPDWTQRFEQISIQHPVPSLKSSSSPTKETYKARRPGNIQTTVDTPSQSPSQDRLPVAIPASQGQRPSIGSEISQGSRLVTVALSPTLQAWEHHDEVSPMTLSNENNDRLRIPHLRHAETWNHTPVAPLADGPISPLDSGFVIPPQHSVQSSWLHGLPSNLDSYYHNGGPSPQSSTIAPFSADPIPNFTPNDLMNFEPYGNFINEDPSTAYSVLSSDNPFQSPSTHAGDFPSHSVYKQQSSDVLNNLTQSQPHTPPPNSYPTPPLHSPSRSRTERSLRSKSHRRGLKSLGNLRTPKSASALKQPKSASALRSPKSATGGFGFVNFTPDDKGKILTGVAPSGSSKTKARRELEAMEKKRRSSHAALKAVEAQGGDVERFKKEFENEGMELAI